MEVVVAVRQKAFWALLQVTEESEKYQCFQITVGVGTDLHQRKTLQMK